MELRTERKLSQKALTEQLQLAGFEKGTRFVPDFMRWWLWQSSSMYPVNIS